jgi:hypothetical protein
MAGAHEVTKRCSWLELLPVAIPTTGRSLHGGFNLDAKHVDLGNCNVALLVEPQEYEDYAKIWFNRLFIILPYNDKASRIYCLCYRIDYIML